MTAPLSANPKDASSAGGRRQPVGAEVVSGGVHFRVWAPDRRRVDVVLEGGPSAELTAEADGYFSALVPEARAGSLYRYRLDGGSLYPDPASRWQPQGVHGPSQVVDPDAFAWTDNDWKGVVNRGQVVYELHLGTFTPEGTWEAAQRQLPWLAELGVTLVEVMPVAEFPGRFGWGYDGVGLYAPTRLYGTPDDFRRFVDEAHRLGLGVLLDVVYNHLGPDGNYLGQFAATYFTDRYQTDWGQAINFDGPGADPVREFFAHNAGYWVREFHLDGLRLDATQNVYDVGPEHILAELTRLARAAAGGRSLFVVAENEPQETRLVRPPERGGDGLDALWNDDFHHSVLVALTGRNEAYYSDFQGSPQELISAAQWGYLYQGQYSRWHKKRRGTPAFDLAPTVFVNFIENHDQVANSARGFRAHQLTSPGRWRAMTALLLLSPGTPMLFQGQEFAASSPFLYFADHNETLAPLVQRGRLEFVQQFPSIADPACSAGVDVPHDPATFARCKLRLDERQRHAWAVALHRDLLRLRRTDPTFRGGKAEVMHGAVLGPEAFLLRWMGAGLEDRLLLINLGRDLHLAAAPEPLLAPPAGAAWRVVWSSEDPAYNGCGTPDPERADGWHVQGHAAVVLAPGAC